MIFNPEKREPDENNQSDIGDDDWLKQDLSEPVNDDWLASDKVEVEKKESKVEFIGEEAEVTIKRSNGEIEGGWECVGPTPGKDGYVTVHNRKQSKIKNIKREELLKIQPFKEGDNVTVRRSNGKVDFSPWVIDKSFGGGYYAVTATIDAKINTKFVKKHDLIEARISQLEGQVRTMLAYNDIIAKDREIIDRIEREIKYWRDKLETIDIINKEAQEKAKYKSVDEDEDLTPSSAA